MDDFNEAFRVFISRIVMDEDQTDVQRVIDFYNRVKSGIDDEFEDVGAHIDWEFED